ncbi:MAG TPA: ATP-binding protein [Longimicrobium sp.]|nr:ATP-binding protein [Longimicrobium sp.]
MPDHAPATAPGSPPRGPAALVAVFAVILALLLSLGVLANQAFRELAGANRWSIHTYQVISEAEGLAAAQAELETTYRGFALSGDPRFLDAWRAAGRDWDAHEQNLRRMTADNPRQQQRMRRLAALSDSFRALQGAARLPPRAGPAALLAARAAAGDTGTFALRRRFSDAIRDTMTGVQREEFALLRGRAERARSLERRARALIVSGGVLAVLLAAAAGVLVLRRTARLREANLLLRGEAAERILARQAAERLARQNELILNAAAEGIYGVDAHGYTTFVNPAAAAMLGYAADDLPGRPYEATLLARAGGEDPVRAALLSGHPRTVTDAAFRRADGTRFPVEFTCTPIVEENHIAGAVITFRDVTERREVDRMKDEFISVVSHELRTPLTAIRGSLGLLAAGKAGDIPTRGQRMLEIAVQNTDRLIRLINDILDIERIESGKVAMEPGPVNVAELVQGAAEVMLPMAERAGVELYVWAEPMRLIADADRILQVLTNLVSNAIKFSPQGTAVQLTVEPEGGEAVFRVADQGRGIPHDRLESIFERFQQVDSSDSRQKGGTGLGLAICRSIVGQHGGRIWAESEPGQGSTFIFTLPLSSPVPDAGEADLGPPPDEAQVEAEPRDGRMHVLVVEDDVGLAGVLAETFERNGVVSDVAGSGEDAWRAARRRVPDAVVLDIAIPGGDGYWLAERFRQEDALRQVPIVAYTALDLNEAERERLRAAGVEVLTKSRVEPVELERRVMALLEHGDGAPAA